jgi:hypothetical protein
MSRRRVVVRVPALPEVGRDTVRAPLITLSATVNDTSASDPTVECLGTLADGADARGSSAILSGVQAVCTAKGRTTDGIQVRASSLAPTSDDLDLAAVAAGASAANALLGLGLSDAAIARLARDVWGIPVPIDRCSVVVHQDCDDDLFTEVTGRRQ